MWTDAKRAPGLREILVSTSNEWIYVMIKCNVGVGVYDRTLPLMAGLFNIEGVDATWDIAPLERIFARAFDEQAFAIAEMSCSNFLYLTATGECPYVGIPVFPSRSFRHSAVFIRTDRGIRSPEDLKGRRVGVREYSMTAALVARGVLEDEYGVRSQDIDWVYGPADAEDPQPIARMLPNGVSLNVIDEGQNLSEMLKAGDIDAMVAYKPPKVELGAGSAIDRLFPNYPDLEADYHRRTGLFPIMHVVGVRRDIADANPGLCVRVCNAFEQARQYAITRSLEEQALFTVYPWGAVEGRRTHETLGTNYWSYGVADNRKDLEALCRYSFAQGISPRQVDVDELFVPETLDWNPASVGA